MRHMRGMTLVELMVAVAIVGTLLGLALVNMQESIERQREREATRELGSFAMRARQRPDADTVVERDLPLAA